MSISFWLSQMREGEAPSYFNAEEALALVGLVEGLLAQTRSKGRDSVQPNDLGVIATYRKQVWAVLSIWVARVCHHGRPRILINGHNSSVYECGKWKRNQMPGAESLMLVTRGHTHCHRLFATQ